MAKHRISPVEIVSPAPQKKAAAHLQAVPASRSPKTTPPKAPPAIVALDEEENVHGIARDRLLHAWQARLTGGLSPAPLQQASADWMFHLLD